MQPASISSRFAAMNLDMLIFMALWQGVGILIESNAPELATFENLLALSLVFSFLYFVIPTRAAGQTLGKMLLGIKVVPKNDEYAKVTWIQAFAREIIGKLISTIPLLLGYFWARFNSDRKAWHDLISGTRVVTLVIEEEKTFLQKFQQLMLGILTIPLGVGLIVIAFLYTSAPLDSIKEKIEAAGIQVGSLTGSLGGGLHFSQISRQDENQNFSLDSVDVKFSVSALVYDRIFIIEKLTAEEGHIEVPPDFSWATVFMNLMAISAGAADGQSGISMGNFKLSKMQLKNISFENNKKVISQLEEFSVKNLEMADKELRIGEAQFKIPGFTIKTLDFKSAFGRLDVASAIGGMGPVFLPLLKAPVDFHFNGAIGKTPKSTKISGGMTIDKIKFSYDGGKLSLNAEKLLLNEMFKTALPLEDLDLKLSAEGVNVLELMSSLNVEYAVKVCGKEFVPEGNKGPTYVRADRKFQFNMTPKPVENFNKMIFAKDATLDQLFIYELHGKKQIAPNFANNQEMVSDLCYRKPMQALNPDELDKTRPLVAAANTVAGNASLQALLLKSVPITVNQASPSEVAADEAPTPTTAPTSTPETTPTPAVTPSPSTTPTPVVSPTPVTKTPDQLKSAMSEARTLLRNGKFADARTILEAPAAAVGSLPAADQGAYYNVKAWVLLYSNDTAQAAHNFEQAFGARKDISDAEGLLRAHEELKNEAEAKKWLEYIKNTLKSQPELKGHLSPNMQKRFNTSAAAAVSRP